MADTPTLQTFTVTLAPGETIVLPSDAIITGVFVDGTAEVTSSCTGTLPESTDYRCGVFYFNIDDDDNDNHPNDQSNTYYRKLVIGDLEFDLDGLLNSVNDPDYLNAYVPPQGLFTFTHIHRFTIDDSETDKRKAVYLYFKVAEPFFDQLELQIWSHIGHILPNVQFYKPLTDDAQEGVSTLECEEYPY
jgi:hypothetical protein